MEGRIPPSLPSEEEIERWRDDVSRYSHQMPLHGRPKNFEELFSLLDEMYQRFGEDAPISSLEIENLKEISYTASVQYGEAKAFLLMVSCIHEDEVDMADDTDEEWDWIDDTLVEFEIGVEERRKTMSPEAIEFYKSEAKYVLNIYFLPGIRPEDFLSED